MAPGADSSAGLRQEISACRLCAPRFAATATAHAPRPVVWFRSTARILIAGQAPGARVHASGRPFDDASGERLRDWLGVDRETFYDTARIAIVPMGFCFPGYDAKGSDLPPPAICRQTWHDRVMRSLPHLGLSVLVGGYAHRYHLGVKTSVTDTVKGWRAHWPARIAVPHPSWRNTGWLRRNPWFETDILPALRQRVAEILHD
ncbi:uracil-DNA glycosylase family protein [Poseidonocella sedimentorum]|uniref:Uracil-DNA glycosylase n=1 Tax=Poseidonocella sedimentorum TaxID=871652 RepID=A0A1I6DYE6_9RHOB|nr:uracil-DNA glycosylase family protein [Poseidonocella sedimentorum]SFR10351.1 Uracil-DNA glycosylase [Poseidonocella sedimentorum]